MALTDDEKLEIVKRAFKVQLESIVTWSEFKTIMMNLTKEKIKAFIMNNLAGRESKFRSDGADHVTNADDLHDLGFEVEGV